jgi:hypothetical protein
LLVQLEERSAFQLTCGSRVIIRSAVMVVGTKLLPTVEGRHSFLEPFEGAVGWVVVRGVRYVGNAWFGSCAARVTNLLD